MYFYSGYEFGVKFGTHVFYKFHTCIPRMFLAASYGECIHTYIQP